MATSLIRRTRPVAGSVKILVSKFPSKYKIELKKTNLHCKYEDATKNEETKTTKKSFVSNRVTWTRKQDNYKVNNGHSLELELIKWSFAPLYYCNISSLLRSSQQLMAEFKQIPMVLSPCTSGKWSRPKCLPWHNMLHDHIAESLRINRNPMPLNCAPICILFGFLVSQGSPIIMNTARPNW